MALTAFVSFQVRGLPEVEAAAAGVTQSFSKMATTLNSQVSATLSSVRATTASIGNVVGQIPHFMEEAGRSVAAAGHEMQRAFTIPITLATAFALTLAKLGPASKDWEAATGRLRLAHQQLGSAFQQLLIPVLNITTGLLRVIAPIVTNLANAFNSLSPATQAAIIAGIALTAAFGPLLRIGGALIELGGKLATGFVFLARQVVALAAAFVTGEVPILGWVALFVAVAAGAAFVYRHLQDVETFIKQGFNYAIDLAIVHLADFQLQLLKVGLAVQKFNSENPLSKTVKTLMPFVPDVDNKPLEDMIKRTQALHDQFQAAAKTDLSGVSHAWAGLRTDVNSDINSILSVVKGAGSTVSGFLGSLVTGGGKGNVALDPGALKAAAELVKKYHDAITDAQVQTSIFGMSERDAFVASKLLAFGLSDLSKLGFQASVALAKVFGEQFDAQKFKASSDAIQKAIDDTNSKIGALGMGEREAFINSGLLSVGLDKIGDPALADKVKLLGEALGKLFDAQHLQDGKRALGEIQAQIDGINISARQGFVESWLAKIPPGAKDARDSMEKLANTLFDLQRAKPFESAVQNLTDMRFKIEDVYTALHDGLSNAIVSGIKNVHNWGSAIKALGQSIGDALLKSLGDTIAGGITGVLTGRSGTGGLLGGLLNRVLNSIGLGGDAKSGTITPGGLLGGLFGGGGGGGIGKGISGDAQGYGGPIKGIFDSILSPLKTIFGDFTNPVKTIFTSFLNISKGIFGSGGQFITGLGQKLSSFLGPLGNMFSSLLGGMSSLFNGLINGLGSVLNSVLGALSGGGGGGLLGNIFSGIGDLLGFGGGGGGIGKAAAGSGGFWDFIGSALSDVLGFFGLANGGDQVVTRPTLFLTGERGPEKVSVKPLGLGASSGFSGAGGHLSGFGAMSRTSPLSRLAKTLDAGGQHVGAAASQPSTAIAPSSEVLRAGGAAAEVGFHPAPSSFAGVLGSIASTARQQRPLTVVMAPGTIVDGIGAQRFARRLMALMGQQERRLV